MYKILLMALLSFASLQAQEVTSETAVPYIPYEIKMGKNFDVVQAQCLMCHSFGYIINQGPQSKEFWKEKVQKMKHAFGMDISDSDAVLVTDYLFTHYGNGKQK